MPEGIQDLPNVDGLGDFVASTMTKDKDQEPPASQEPAQVQVQIAEPPVTPPDGQPKEFDLAQFKSPRELLKSYKEVQGWATRVSQERKAAKEEAEALKAQLSQMKEALDIQRLQTVAPPQIQDKPKSFDEAFVEDPEKAVELAVERKLQTARVADVLEQEESKNPAEFQERYSYAMRLRQAYPNLATSPQGVRKLFELADRYREGEMKKNAERSVKLVFGEDVDFEKFKRLIAKDGAPLDKINPNLAYMPDTSSGIRADAGKPKNAYDTQISEAVQKGDVDSVIKGIFNKKLAAG